MDCKWFCDEGRNINVETVWSVFASDKLNQGGYFFVGYFLLNLIISMIVNIKDSWLEFAVRLCLNNKWGWI